MEYEPQQGHATSERGREAWGWDAERSARPGVPKEAEPHAAEGSAPGRPRRQSATSKHFHRAGLDRLTPVYGTAQPPRGAAGQIRRAAYRIPEHYARHWALLVLADRVDVLEDRLGELIGRLAHRAGVPDGLASRIERNPLPALLGVVGAALVVRRALR